MITRSCLAVTVAGLALVVACDETPTGPTTPLAVSFMLAPGESGLVTGTSLRVTFLRVSADSRCPGDAICVRAGDAIVHVRLANGSSAEYELHTENPTQSTIVYQNYRITLEQLDPYPFSSRPPIAPGDYRARISVSR